MVPLKGRRIALIGGAGFVGHHLALMMAREGAQVEIVDSLQVNNLLSHVPNARSEGINPWYYSFLNERLSLLKQAGVPVHIQDARDYHKLTMTLAHIRPQVVIHLAAIAHADRSNKDPYSTFDHSLRTLENALDFSRDGLEHFIFFSSSMVYGNFSSETVTEKTPCEPLGMYGALKFAGEKIVIAYNQVFDLPYTIIRPSALYGERCVSRRAGQIFIENALMGKEITVNGDGSDRLDFTYISDLIDGIRLVLTTSNSKNQILNLTYGKSRSVRDMLNILADFFPQLPIQYKPKDKLIPNRGTLSVDKAKNLIGYEPRYPLEKGYVEYIRWYQQLRKP